MKFCGDFYKLGCEDKIIKLKGVIIMKKSNIKWKDKLAVKIPLVNTGIIFVAIVVMCALLSVLARDIVSTLVQKEVSYVADANAQEAKAYLDSMNIFSSAVAKEVKRYKGFDRKLSEQMIEDSLINVLDNDRIFSAYVAFEPNKYFPNTPKGLSYYAFPDGSGIKMEVLNNYEEYGPADYYAVPKQLMSTHVTEPYAYQLTEDKLVWLITLSNPILDDSGNFIGIASCDILMDSIGELNYSTGGYKSTQSYIITGQGTVIADSFDKGSIGAAMQSTGETTSKILEASATAQPLLVEEKIPATNNKTAIIMHRPITIEGTDLVWSSAFAVSKAEALAEANKITIAMVTVGMLGVLVLTIFSMLALKKALGPIVPVMELAEKMGAGDLTNISENTVKTKDELGQLSSIFHETAEVLSGYITEISSILDDIAAGRLDLSIEREYIGDFTTIKQALNHILSSLNSTFKDMQSVAEQVSTGSEQVASGAQALSQGATQQASSVEELSASIAEISQQVKDSAVSAAVANEKAKEVGEKVEKSNMQMQQMLGAMESINSKSNEIGKIVKAIEDIAFQTNILALNAAVEAARAGAAGKGFAVVADEVRNLASKSAAAAKDTTVLIESTLSSVEEGVVIAQTTAGALISVVDGAKDIIDAISQISQKAQHEAVGLEQVMQGVDQIAMVVQTTSATAEESAATSEELSGQAQYLSNLIAKFKLKNETGSAKYTVADNRNDKMQSGNDFGLGSHFDKY